MINNKVHHQKDNNKDKKSIAIETNKPNKNMIDLPASHFVSVSIF